MEGTAFVERCPNCGAPLELEDGKRRWCGLAGGTRASIADTVRLLNETRNDHHWKKQIKKAGAVPQALQPLRASVPHP
jgi:hypothetical protein